MRRLILISLFSLFFVISCGGSGNSNSGAGQEEDNQEPAEEPKAERIIVLGDSIAVGVNASVRFPDMLQGLTGLEVINQSHPGYTAGQASADAMAVIDRYNPKYIAVLLGTNNARGASTVEGAINNMRYLTRIAQEHSIIPILGTLPPILNSSADNSRAATISAAIRGISGARIADVRAAMSASDISSDGFHPNDTGQRIIATVFAGQVY